MGLIKGETRSLDNGSHEGLRFRVWSLKGFRACHIVRHIFESLRVLGVKQDVSINRIVLLRNPMDIMVEASRGN